MTDARMLTERLAGKWYGSYGTAPCPVCQPEQHGRQNALTLSDGDARLLAHCKKSDCGFRDILAAAGVVPGDVTAPDPAAASLRAEQRKAETARRAAQARTVWQETRPLAGTVAETYLRAARGITCALPETLRFHPACWHGATASRRPALVACVDGGDGFAVHRTYLRADGSGKADVEPQKAMLGAVAGGAVRLSGEPGPLVVAEGIETALSLLCGLLRAPRPVWAALSTSGIRSLRLPVAPGRLTIAPDDDPAGRAATVRLAERAAGDGWTVSILAPPDGGDFNDLLTREVAR